MGVITILAQGAGTPDTTGTSGSGWDIMEVLSNLQATGTDIGGAVITIAGLVCMILGGVFTAKKLASNQAREGWGKIAGLVGVGGLLFFGGLAFIMNLSSGAKNTLDDMGNTGAMSSISVPYEAPTAA